MQVNIRDYFDFPSFEQWQQAALKSLKTQDPQALNKYQAILGIEDLTYHIATDEKDQETYLNSFPTKRILAREILIGQPHVETQDVGIEYVFAQGPMAISEKQKLIQIVKDKGSQLFGDEVLLDVFNLLEQFEFSHQDLLAYLEKMVKKPNVHLLVDGTALHNAGSVIADELAHSLFLALKYSTLFFENSRKICFKVAVDSTFFAQIAKLRALRYLFETILEKEEISPDNFLIIATPSLREMTLYDPWVNMLRATSAVSCSFLGGADVITPLSFDILNQVYNMQASSALALRQSRNLYHVLNDESHLAFVNDPARGSYLIEDLTIQIIQKTFVKLKELNTQKSMKFLYEKLAQEALNKSRERYQLVESRVHTLCGVNDYANIGDKLSSHFNRSKLSVDEKKLFPLRRLASEFELLRLEVENTLAKQEKKILILYYGDRKKINARISFCMNYFEILGLEVELQDSQSYMSFDAQKYFAVVYCAQDDEYTAMFDLVESLPDLQLFLAGKKVSKPGMINLYQGQNTFQILQDFVERALM